MVKEAYNNLEEFKKALAEEGTVSLNKIYLIYKEDFFNFCSKFNIAEDQIADIYQDSIIAFYENVQKGKLTELKSSLKTYIFSIGKYSIYNLKKKERRVVSIDDEHISKLDLSMISPENDSDDRITLVQDALNSIGENCKKIIVLFYYQAYTIEALMHEFDYKNENVVRAHKSRCLKNLKSILQNNF